MEPDGDTWISLGDALERAFSQITTEREDAPPPSEDHPLDPVSPIDP